MEYQCAITKVSIVGTVCLRTMQINFFTMVVMKNCKVSNDMPKVIMQLF